MLVSPSDHAVARPGVLREAVRTGVPAARAGHLVVFGLPADHAATGYGWIVPGAPLHGAPGVARVASFEEKPDAVRAGELLQAGACWNAGLFLVEAGVLRAELQQHAPEIAAAAERAVGRGTWDRDQLRLEAQAFAAAPGRSLDHAVVEHTERAAVVQTDPGWSDVGDFGALWAALAGGSDRDVVTGEVVAVDTSGCYLRAEGIPLAVAGVHDLIVVATPEGVLVVPRERAQDVRTLVEALRRRSSS
jgi:mannose-1-phosphate guanylyltransferase/mannose-1-phosphate guanylyltransferase/mannose-6-phosphate isomerase